jgi:hypothetical protein
MLTRIFPSCVVRGDFELSSRVKARVKLDKYDLGTLARSLLNQHLDKRIEHHLWQTRRYLPRQIMYAATDPYAHLLIALRLGDPAPFGGVTPAPAEMPPIEAPAQALAPAPRSDLADLTAVTLDENEVFDLTDAADATPDADADEGFVAARVACSRRRGGDGGGDSDEDSDDVDELADPDLELADDDEGEGNPVARADAAEAAARTEAIPPSADSGGASTVSNAHLIN